MISREVEDVFILENVCIIHYDIYFYLYARLLGCVAETLFSQAMTPNLVHV